jgi:two-component system chemotaxis sensor kinase CheA
VINQAILAQQVQGEALGKTSGVPAALEDLDQLTRQIQDSVMAIRAQPVKSVFQRMQRLAREMESMTASQVRLITEGEATEVDRTVIEHLTDPLTHMVRNAIDHGLERPEDRDRERQAERGHGATSPRSTAPAGSSSRCPTTAAASTASGCARRPVQNG